ncbi:UNVERIFIED_CONTAM: hypothetical protein FKN15_073387 [Acipenser sinensis]
MALQRHFGKAESAVSLRHHLTTRKRGSGEKLGILAADTRYLLQRGYPGLPPAVQEDLEMEAFIRGLNPTTLRQQVWLVAPTSLEQALTDALRIEAVLEEAEQDQTPKVCAVREQEDSDGDKNSAAVGQIMPKHQYARILISGFLLVAVGLLVTVVGFWFPLCSPKLEYKNCSFLPMQILGPMAVVVGLGLFITGCIRRKQNFNEMEENQALPEGLPNHSEPHHIIVGDSVVIFPTPPPAYFTEAPPLRTGNHGNISIGYESPPPYYSTFNQRVGTGLGDEESVYTIRVSRASIVGLPSHHSFLPELPPPYQKRESASQDQQAVYP